MIPWFAVVMFPPGWLFVLWLLAKLSGWEELGGRYRNSHTGELVVRPMQTVYVGLVAYGALNIAIETKGLHLRQLAPFRPFHPPLLIPWQEIYFGSVSSIMFKKNACLKVGNERGISLCIPLSVFDDEQLRLLEELKKVGAYDE